MNLISKDLISVNNVNILKIKIRDILFSSHDINVYRFFDHVLRKDLHR